MDLSSWEKKIQRDAVAMGTEGDQPEDGLESVLVEHHSDVAMEMNSPTQELYKDGVLTLGCIGKPLTVHSSYTQVVLDSFSWTLFAVLCNACLAWMC